MSIEWSLYEVRPVGRAQLVEAAVRMADLLLGNSVLDFSESLMSISCAGGSDTFTSQVYATHDGFRALVDVEAGPLVEDDGEVALGCPLLGTVSSRRTLLSASLGLVVALSWLGQGGGELAGPGLDEISHKDDVALLVERFRQDEYVGRRRIERLAKSVVGEGARMNFA